MPKLPYIDTLFDHNYIQKYKILKIFLFLSKKCGKYK